MAVRVTASRLANLGANAILDAFSGHAERFHEISRRGQGRFERREWHALHHDSVERLELYREVVQALQARIVALLHGRVEDKLIWASMKAVYSGLIVDRDDWEIAETFFNSLTRRIFSTVGLDPQIEFVHTDFETPPSSAKETPYDIHDGSQSTVEILESVFASYPFAVPYEDAGRDARLVAERIERQLGAAPGERVVHSADFLRAVFYRGTRAFIVGRLHCRDRMLPLALALANCDGGIFVDATLLTGNEVSILFSFARSYFLVDVERPFDVVRFLRTLIPRKRIAELYSALGFHKHGKTELYRDLMLHLSFTDGQFDIAPGTPGMVMVAFCMPRHDLILKVIKDRFPPEKSTTRKKIREKYRMVFTHERVGRMVEAQQFEHLELSRERFTESLLERLLSEAGETVSVDGDSVVIRHVYVERRVTPLNLYFEEADADARRAAIIDYGQAIRDMAVTNIFPGDLLIKNFGVTRHGRVVFYDYDELTLMTECKFRKMPQARFEEDEMSAGPWFSVGPDDIFPEEFRTFLGLRGDLAETFDAHHAELFEASWWRGVQKRLGAGEVVHILPYRESLPRDA